MAVRPISWGSAVTAIRGGSYQLPPDKGSRRPSPRRIINAETGGARIPHAPGSGMQRSPTVRRGSLVAINRSGYDPGTNGVTGRIFMFNPNEIDDANAVNYGTTEIPGASQPVYQYGSTGERLITFTLYIDGDRGRFGRSQSRNPENPMSLSIKDELYWYRSLVYPASYGKDYGDVAPYQCLFSFGEIYRNVLVVVKKADWKVNYWVPGPNGPIPVRATIPIVLGVTRQRSIVSGEILNAAGLFAPGFGDQ